MLKTNRFLQVLSGGLGCLLVSWGTLGAMWEPCVPILEHFEAVLAHHGALLELSWDQLVAT